MQAQSVSSTKEAHGQRPLPKDFRPDIEGLRGFTLLAILGFHTGMPGVSGGFVGPDIFFFISGFVITGALWREVSTTGTLGLRRFFGGRARRLLPVAATVGVVTMIASALSCCPSCRPKMPSRTASPARYTSPTTGSLPNRSTISPAACPRRSSTTGLWAWRSSSICCGRP